MKAGCSSLACACVRVRSVIMYVLFRIYVNIIGKMSYFKVRLKVVEKASWANNDSARGFQQTTILILKNNDHAVMSDLVLLIANEYFVRFSRSVGPSPKQKSKTGLHRMF